MRKITFLGILLVFIVSLLVISISAIESDIWCQGADLNQDGVVNQLDADLFNTEWGGNDCSEDNDWCNGADLNGDGNVNIFDAYIMNENFERQDCVGEIMNEREDNEEECIVAGNAIAINPDETNMCCEGLNQISPYSVNSDGSCELLIGTILCSDCGNGVCEEWENKCNCEEDCIEKNEGEMNDTSYLTEPRTEYWCNGADLNGDGNVDTIDNDLINLEYQRNDCVEPDWCNGADLNGDGNVDIWDYFIMNENFERQDCVGEVIEEPLVETNNNDNGNSESSSSGDSKSGGSRSSGGSSTSNTNNLIDNNNSEENKVVNLTANKLDENNEEEGIFGEILKWFKEFFGIK